MKLIIFLFILWQVRTILKKVFEKISEAPQTDGKAPATLSWQEKLKGAAEKIKADIEAERNRQAKAGQQKKTVQPKKSSVTKGKPDPMGRSSRQKHSPAALKQQGAPAAARENAREFVSPEESAPLPDPSCALAQVKGFSHTRRGLYGIGQRKNLCNSVVWSEILAPPLSMRDEKKNSL